MPGGCTMNEPPTQKPPQPVYIPYPGREMPNISVRLNAVEVRVAMPTPEETLGALEHVLGKIHVKVAAEGFDYG